MNILIQLYIIIHIDRQVYVFQNPKAYYITKYKSVLISSREDDVKP